MKKFVRPILMFPVAAMLLCGEWQLGAASVRPVPDAGAGLPLSRVTQLRTVSGEDFLAGCHFRLSGVVTLVDVDRKFFVLQDTTGALGLDCQVDELNLQVGERVTVDALNCVPLFTRFPDYPHRPSGWDLRDSFEAPQNWGEYHLTRMRGFLHPPVSGEYTFSIASDNSSELWLSGNEDPSKIRKVASVARFQWTLSREWSKFSSQRSESIWLNAGQSYYIEALQEQSTLGENLAVAWHGPGIAQSVIPAANLTPWNKDGYSRAFPATNGILREYWTNYSAGDLSGLGGARPFESALSVGELHVIAREPAQLPEPIPISANQEWLATNSYRWTEVEGVVTFVGEDGQNAFIEIAGDKTQLQVRTFCSDSPLRRLRHNVPVRVVGVCEEIYDETGTPAPGLLWVTIENSVSAFDAPSTDSIPVSVNQSLRAKPNPAAVPMGGFYGTRGVVTFNDRVFGKNYLSVQEGNAAMFVSLENFGGRSPLKVGELVDLGGSLQPGEFLPIITPLVITEIGTRSLPAPLIEPIQSPIPANRDGRWTEVQGVVHSVNSNGTLAVMSSHEPVSVWLGNATSNELSRYVDSKLRVRGVLSLSTFDTPVLLVPSRSFLEIDEAAPESPFRASVRFISDLDQETNDPASLHRVRVAGEVTLRDTEWFFVQDGTGGIRVRTLDPAPVKIGDAVEVLGFPMVHGATRSVVDASVRVTSQVIRPQPHELDFSDGLPIRQNGSLVHIRAVLLGVKMIGNSQILELQDKGRIFTAALSTNHGSLNGIVLGSQLEIIGVCDTESTVLPLGTTPKEKAAFASLNLWLRSPADVNVLHGPPWWTWKRTALLIGVLFLVLTGALLWVHLLRRRLDRQKAAQFAFSQQVLKRLEDERNRIAANLHDGLGQVLLAIRNQSLLALQRSPEQGGFRQRLNDISDATSQALDEVRQITQGLRPYQLNKLGLTQAIRATVTRISSDSQIVFASRVEDVDKAFDKDSDIHVYRIVQEAINNVIKHSAATEAAVVIKNRANIVSLSIRDNGRGFDVNSLNTSAPHELGYGLSGIAERVRILGGTLAIESRPGQGTSLNIEIPVPVCRS